MSFDPASTAAAIAQGLLPETSRVFVPDGGTIGNVSFVAIPYNAAHARGAQVVANFLLDPKVQAQMQNIEILGSFSVLDLARLDNAARARFEGSAALGSFLVLRFTLHNLTEGIGIVAPMVWRRPSLWVFAALAALAGLPAVAGVWLGSYAFSPHWAALAFAVGAGAILQVIVEVGGLLVRDGQREGRPWLSGAALAGAGSGAAVMYVTALLVQV